jgi:hypothetical protein
MRDPDPLIRRLERDAAVWAGLATVAALAIRPDLPGLAAGVAGGGLLALASLWAIRSSVDALLSRITAATPGTRPETVPDPSAETSPEPSPEPSVEPRAAPGRAGAGLAMKMAGRYALLGLGAYVMIVRLRLHAVGVLIGASSLAAAASFEAVRVLRRS